MNNYFRTILYGNITKPLELPDCTLNCCNMPHDTIASRIFSGVKSLGTSGFLVYGPYIEITKAMNLVVELSYIAPGTQAGSAGTFDINLSKKGADGEFEFIQVAQCALPFNGMKRNTAMLSFNTENYLGYKVEFRVYVEEKAELYAFQIRTQNADKSPRQNIPVNQKTDSPKVLLGSKILKTVYIASRYPRLLIPFLTEKLLYRWGKARALIGSLINSIRYQHTVHMQEPMRIDHLPWQLQRRFKKNHELLKTDLATDDRYGIHPLQLPNACYQYMPRNDNGLYQRQWCTAMIEDLKNRALRKEDFSCESYPGSVLQFYSALDQVRVKNKKTVVIGSVSPWLECILMSYDAQSISTIEYGTIPYNGNDIQIIDRLTGHMPAKYSCDIVCSFSSIEHNGLGRYGDPIDRWRPNNDG